MRVVLWVIAVAVVIGLGYSTVYRAGPFTFGKCNWGSKVHRTDFTVYTAAGQAVQDGTDIYAARNLRGWAYVYPPPFAILMVPFARLPLFWSAMLWYVLSLFFLIDAVVKCVRLVADITPGTDESGRLILAIGPLIVLGVWFMPGLARGQVNTLLLWLAVGAVYWHRKGQDWYAGSCLAGATLLKVFPIVLLGYFVWRQRWRFALATLVALVVLTLGMPALVFGWQKNIDYLTEWGHVVAQPSLSSETERENSPLHEQLISNQKLRNQSLEPVLWRLTGGKAARGLAVVAGLTMAGVIWWVGRKSAPENELLIVSSVFVWMLLAQPLAESHYFVLLLLPVTGLVLLARSAVDRQVRRVALWTWGMMGVVGLATSNVKPLRFYGALCWISLVLWAVLLWVAYRAKSSQRISNLPIH